MRKLSFIWYIILMITLPVGIILMSGNLVMRTSVTYVYHFNDSQVVSKVGSAVTGSEFADSISGYFNSIGGDEFQVYEVNGEFRDPIFDKEESEVMERGRNIMTVTLLSGIVFLGISFAIYFYLMGTSIKSELRIVGYIALALALVGVFVSDMLVRLPSFRASLYNRFINVHLNDASTIKILLGSPFEKTYIIFSTFLSVAIICILIYIHHSVTKERRLFS